MDRHPIKEGWPRTYDPQPSPHARTALVIVVAIVIVDDYYLVRRGRGREPRVDLGIDHSQPVPVPSDAGWDREERVRDDVFNSSVR
jgi:hypothetical protein